MLVVEVVELHLNLQVVEEQEEQVVVEMVVIQVLVLAGTANTGGGGGGGANPGAADLQVLILVIRWFRNRYCQSTRNSKYFSKSRN
jgi:hypothetical protein